MKKLLWMSLLLPVLASEAAPVSEQRLAPVRRFALLVGVNDGGPGRPRLRYAASDARAFGRVLEELGGVQPSDTLMLEEVDRAGLLRGLERLKAMVAEAGAAGGRTEALVYYSGHSDEEGLLLREERVEYGELRRALEALPADVRIAVLDSCASGTLARRKGGKRRPAFLVDASASVRGHAILTSSSEDESSQESDRIGGSYFTHNLVTGLRGAADATGDGRVTLHEAYQFAFHETLARTERTRGGAQHPAYDIELAGAGDLVLTDLRTTDAGLTLAEPLDGRLYIRNAVGQLVVELNKQGGRTTELGLQPGDYTVLREQRGQTSTAGFSLKAGGKVVLAERDFSSVASEVTALRGGGGGEGVEARHYRFFNLAFAPRFQTNDMLEGPVDNGLSLAMGVGSSARLDGAALALGGNWATESVSGAQLAIGVNGVNGPMSGAQLSVGGNWASGDVEGVQSTVGLNSAGGALSGVQMAVGANTVSEGVVGLQLGVGANWAASDMSGVQLAAGLNRVAGQMRGLQVGSGVSMASGLEGMQLSLINVGGDVSGLQLGLVNVAGRMRGVQLGLVNLSNDIEGAPIGLLSISRNGQFHVETFGSDVSPTNVALKFGGRNVHTIITAGFGKQRDGERQWTLGLGLGAHIPFSETFFLDADVVTSSVHGSGEGWNSYRLLNQLRVLGGWYPTRYFAFIGGPTLNVLTSADERPVGKVTWIGGSNGRGQVAVWPGVQLGLRI